MVFLFKIIFSKEKYSTGQKDMYKKIKPGVAIAIVLFAAAASVFFLFRTNRVEAPAENKNQEDKTSQDPKEPSKTGTSEAEDKTGDWLEYKNYEYNYSIKYPKNWTINGKKLDKVQIMPQDFPDMPLYFEISVVPVSENINIDNLIRNAMAEDLSGGRRMNKEEAKVSGISGYAVSSCGKFECVTQKWAVVSDGLFYFLNSKNGASPVFDGIFSTFKFIK